MCGVHIRCFKGKRQASSHGFLGLLSAWCPPDPCMAWDWLILVTGETDQRHSVWMYITGSENSGGTELPLRIQGLIQEQQFNHLGSGNKVNASHG